MSTDTLDDLVALLQLAVLASAEGRKRSAIVALRAVSEMVAAEIDDMKGEGS
jgi:hypothetical protein